MKLVSFVVVSTALLSIAYAVETPSFHTCVYRNDNPIGRATLVAIYVGRNALT